MFQTRHQTLIPKPDQESILAPSSSHLPNANLNSKPKQEDPSKPTTPTTTFSISSLPAELRLEIYTLYLSSLPHLAITSTNASLKNLHALTPLHLSSPFFVCDIPPIYFYQNCTFVFPSGEAMRTFAGTGNEESDQNIGSGSKSLRRSVRRIVIKENDEGKEASNGVVVGRDWVFLMNACFENLERVVFTCICYGDKRRGGGCERCEMRDFGSWWEALVDAVREGRGGQQGKEGGRLVLSSYAGFGREEVVRFVC